MGEMAAVAGGAWAFFGFLMGIVGVAISLGGAASEWDAPRSTGLTV